MIRALITFDHIFENFSQFCNYCDIFMFGIYTSLVACPGIYFATIYFYLHKFI